MQKFVVVKKSQNTNNKLEQPSIRLPVINSHSTTSNNPHTIIPTKTTTTTPPTTGKTRLSIGLQQKSIASSTEMTPSHVKMSGYLKKKRNKMTGWRKLWFILQNQLLLSYSSKDDYEKKLAPFKDVLNLVPGTIIRPTKGPRFIIETSTNIIYTYRCDDIKTCSEWITALMESLGACTVQHDNNNILSQNLHYSLDNLTNNIAIPKKMFQSSKSWDSVYRTKITKSPNLPIAKSTAKILKRNGIQQQQQQSESSDGTIMDIGNEERVQNFRLHQNNLKVNQSQDVSRINSMFINNTNNNHTNNRCDTNNNLNLIKCNKRILIEQNHSNRNNLSGNIKNRKNQIYKNRKNTNSFENRMDSNENNDIDCENYSSIEEQIQRISLGEEQTSCSTESENEHLISSSDHHPSLNINQNHKNNDNDEPNINDNCSNINEMEKLQENITMNDKEPIYAVVDLKNKYARRAKIKEMEIKMSHDKIHERPRSYHVSSNDYEEVLHFANCVDSKDDENENIYEPINIPELMPKSPMWKYFSKLNIEALVEITKRKKDIQTTINNKPVPELTTFSDIRKRWGNHRKSIKNRMKRIYGKESKMDCNNYDECNLDECNINTNNGNITNANEHNHNAIVASSSSASSSTSSVNTNLNGKLPLEKKSTSSSSSATVSSASSSSTTSSMLKTEFEKYRKGEKHIFGSLGRLKKPRTSLCLDDQASSPRKKLVISPSNNSNNYNKIDVQQELKLDDKNNHTENKMRQCHSKFYD